MENQINILIEQYLEYLNDPLDEAKRTSMSKITRNTKIRRATGQLASIEARKKNDGMYKNMIRYRTLYFKYRDMIHRKYGSRVRAKARR